MRLKVYLETTVVSYYTADPSRDLVIAGRQESTREFWKQLGQQVEPYVSALVIQEARRGNVEFAEKRMDAIRVMPILELTTASEARPLRNDSSMSMVSLRKSLKMHYILPLPR